MKEIKLVKDQYISLDKIKKIAIRKTKIRNLNKKVEIIKIEKVYKKFFFLKVITKASRYPFKAKKLDYVIFLDSVLGIAGLVEGVPKWEKTFIGEDKIVASKYSNNEILENEDKLIEKFIFKQYLLKRPEINKRDIVEIYLAYWKCTMIVDNQIHIIYLNASTGKKDI
ncbi:hypothetical protein CULT_2370004 [[Clostridium] ultunense Esp]|nr:hypothetical protein CULT_2370004 [[Clostridium] ultunense Esp]